MERRAMMWLAAFAVLASVTSAASGETLADVKKKIESQVRECQTLRQDVRMTMDVGGPGGKMVATSTMEFARRGKDKWVTRTDIVMKGPKEDGESGSEQMKMTMIYDGQFVYNISEQDGQKMAMKMRADRAGRQVMTEPSGFAEMEKQYDLNLLPDQKIDGKNTWVIEAKLRKGEARQGDFHRIVMHYDQVTGILVKTISYDKNGKVAGTMEVLKTATNMKIPEERFQVPPGVQVMDMSAGSPTMAVPQGDGESPEE